MVDRTIWAGWSDHPCGRSHHLGWLERSPMGSIAPSGLAGAITHVVDRTIWAGWSDHPGGRSLHLDWL